VILSDDSFLDFFIRLCSLGFRRRVSVYFRINNRDSMLVMPLAMVAYLVLGRRTWMTDTTFPATPTSFTPSSATARKIHCIVVLLIFRPSLSISSRFFRMLAFEDHPKTKAGQLRFRFFAGIACQNVANTRLL
jgi:hypothetical protein